MAPSSRVLVASRSGSLQAIVGACSHRRNLELYRVALESCLSLLSCTGFVVQVLGELSELSLLKACCLEILLEFVILESFESCCFESILYSSD
ncbi:hypothetical protein M5K25_006860 [Dendrobium thyrsiflorum]|uniref:Uncharacterized protein n=1 Tax=Dendrobium thyrsiflorum TaxID=117978 RepID=A0ABD0VDP7_DENTH